MVNKNNIVRDNGLCLFKCFVENKNKLDLEVYERFMGFVGLGSINNRKNILKRIEERRGEIEVEIKKKENKDKLKKFWVEVGNLKSNKKKNNWEMIKDL